MARETSHGYQYQSSAYDYDRDVWPGKKQVWTDADKEAHYESGQYCVYVQVQWRDSEEDSYVLSAYGPSQVTFQLQESHDKHAFLKELFMDLAGK